MNAEPPEVAVLLSSVRIDTPDDVNLILGQAHFIKTVEDLHEALVGTSPHLRFGIGFCESSGPKLIRRSGNDAGLVEQATRSALAIGAGLLLRVATRRKRKSLALAGL